MFHPNQFVDVVATALGLAEDGGAVAVGKLRRAGENPEVAVGAAADEHVAVVGVDEHDAIVGVERAEEGYAEQRGNVGQFSLALGRLGLAILDARVDDVDVAVVASNHRDRFLILPTTNEDIYPLIILERALLILLCRESEEFRAGQASTTLC